MTDTPKLTGSALIERAKEMYLAKGDKLLAPIARALGVSGRALRTWRDEGAWDADLVDIEIAKSREELTRTKCELGMSFSQMDAMLAGGLLRLTRALDGCDRDGNPLKNGAKPEFRPGEAMWLISRFLSDRRTLLKDIAEAIDEGYPKIDPAHIRLVVASRPRGELPPVPPPPGQADPSDTATELLERMAAVLPFKRKEESE